MRSMRAMLSVVILAGVYNSGAAESAVAVSVASPARRDVTHWVRLPASVEADAEVVYTAKVSGFLKDFTCDVGDRIKPGQLIGRLDAPELEQDVKLVEAQVKEAQSEYQKAQAQVDREKVRTEELDAQEAIDKADLTKAKAEAALSSNLSERADRLFAKDAVTEQERDIQKFSVQQKDAAVLSAEKKLEGLKAARDIWQKELAVAESSAEAARSKMQVAQATLERAKVWCAYTELLLPQIGTHKGAETIVVRRYVANGDLISGGMTSKTGGQPIVALQVVDPVRVVADIPETDAIGLEAGVTVRIQFHNLKIAPAEYKISRTSNSLSTMSRTLRIEIDVPNPKNELRPGAMANVELASEVHKSVLAIPASCVLTEKHDTSVFVIDGNKAKKMGVKLGLQGASWVEVLSPSISESAMLVKDLGTSLEDGAAVAVKPAE